MKVKNINYYNETASLPIDLKGVFTRIQDNLNSFLQSIKRDYSESFEIIIEVLKNRFHQREELPIEIERTGIVNRYPDLWEGSLSFILAKMNYSQYRNNSEKNIPLSGEKVEVKVNDFLRSMLFFNYYLATSLIEILPRGRAIEYYKGIISQRIRDQRDIDKFIESLDKFDEQSTQFFETYQGHNGVVFRINAGKMGIKYVKCRWHEIMKELNDLDFCYAVACHGDFEAVKNENPAFVLTRTRTLMQGDDYCDFCLHDTRIVKEVEHPAEEFWNNN